jgi:hypothetical protein
LIRYLFNHHYVCVRIIPTADEVPNCGNVKMGLPEFEDWRTVGLPAGKVKEKFFMACDMVSLGPVGKYSHFPSLFQHTRTHSVLCYFVIRKGV